MYQCLLSVYHTSGVSEVKHLTKALSFMYQGFTAFLDFEIERVGGTRCKHVSEVPAPEVTNGINGKIKSLTVLL